MDFINNAVRIVVKNAPSATRISASCALIILSLALYNTFFSEANVEGSVTK